MLANLENIYLYILRIIILTAATLTLIGAVIGLTLSIHSIANLAGFGPSTTSKPIGTLSDFISSKQLAGVTAGANPTQVAAPPVPARIQNAVSDLVNYDRTRLGGALDTAATTSVFMANLSSIPDQYQDRYADSVGDLMGELQGSKGTPLSMDTINELINWHLEQFKAAIQTESDTEQSERVAAMQSLGVAAGAVGFFILVVFCFLFVKIERNLRLVRMTAVGPDRPPTGPVGV